MTSPVKQWAHNWLGPTLSIVGGLSAIGAAIIAAKSARASSADAMRAQWLASAIEILKVPEDSTSPRLMRGWATQIFMLYSPVPVRRSMADSLRDGWAWLASSETLRQGATNGPHPPSGTPVCYGPLGQRVYLLIPDSLAKAVPCDALRDKLPLPKAPPP